MRVTCRNRGTQGIVGQGSIKKVGNNNNDQEQENILYNQAFNIDVLMGYFHYSHTLLGTVLQTKTIFDR